uniref:Uncharacterized protein n=1 Tax=Arundo donax TaxID=35708 RepID=A0A0A9FZT5_ARUDO
MATDEQQQGGTARISSSSAGSGRLVTPFWREKYERDARRYWDIFYKRHEDKVTPLAMLIASFN